MFDVKNQMSDKRAATANGDAEISLRSDGCLSRVARGQGPFCQPRLSYQKTSSSFFSHTEIKTRTHSHGNTSQRNPEFGPRSALPACPLLNSSSVPPCEKGNDKELRFSLNANQFPDILCLGCFYGWPAGWSELQGRGHFGEFNLPLHHCGHSVCQQKHPGGLSLFYNHCFTLSLYSFIVPSLSSSFYAVFLQSLHCNRTKCFFSPFPLHRVISLLFSLLSLCFSAPLFYEHIFTISLSLSRRIISLFFLLFFFFFLSFNYHTLSLWITSCLL